MKKTTATLVALSFAFLSAHAAAPESILFSETAAAFSCGSYPSVCELASELESSYPSSPYLPKALLLGGESSYWLSRYSECERLLKKYLSMMHSENSDCARARYFLGCAQMSSGKKDEALGNFHRTCFIEKIHGADKKNPLTAKALYASAQIFFEAKKAKDAVPLLEEILLSPSGLGLAEYKNSFSMLFDCYTELGMNKRLTAFFEASEKILKRPEYGDIYPRCMVSAGSSYEALGEYKKAWDCYYKVIKSDDYAMASLALQKAYSVASLHKKEVGENPAEILADVESSFADSPDLLSEFWTRLATDAFECSDFEHAKKYFEDSEKNDSSKKYTLIKGLYLAAMNPESAAEILEAHAKKGNLEKSSPYYGHYELAFARIALKNKDWTSCIQHSRNASSSRTSEKVLSGALYAESFALCKKGKPQDALKNIESHRKFLSEDNSMWHEFQVLYARSLSECGRNEDSVREWTKAFDKGVLTDSEKADFARTLFSCGYAKRCLSVCLSLSSPSALYLSGLCYFNMQHWDKASSCLEKFLASDPSSDRRPYAEFYLGYCTYQNHAYSTALSLLRKFIAENSGHSLLWNASMTACDCAAFSGNLSEVVFFAESALNSSSSKKQKEESILRCVSAYSDAGQYEKAVEVLRVPAKENSAFGARCRYQSALLFHRMGRLGECDKMLSEIVSKFPSSPLAEESSWMRGEIYYECQEWDTARIRFEEYRKRFVSGKQVALSYYYIGSCFMKTGQTGNASAQFQLLSSLYPESDADLLGRKRQAELYLSQGQYSEAEKIFSGLLSSTLPESEKNSVRSSLETIRQLDTKKYSTELLVLKQKYLELGETDSAGRHAATEYAKKLFSYENHRKESALLCERLSAMMKKDKTDAELPDLCECMMILSRYEKSDAGNLKKAASLFLETAEYSRKCGLDDYACLSMYSAAEIFGTLGLSGDCRAVAEKIIELYPDNSYAKKARSFLN